MATHSKRNALRYAAAMAAAAAAASGGADATPTEPIVEEVTPPAIVEEVKTPEAPADDLYQQIDKAYEDMEKGNEPTIVVTEPEKKDDTAPVTDPETEPEKEPEEEKADIKETPATPVTDPEIKTTEKKDEGKLPVETPVTPVETVKPATEEPAKAPATGNTGTTTANYGRKGSRRAALAWAKAQAQAAADKQAREDAKEDAKNGVQDPVQGIITDTPKAPTTRPGYGTENKFAEDANWGSDDQASAVKAFLDEHPTGSAWDDNAVYKNYAGCAAYAYQLQDIAYKDIATTKSVEIIRDPYQVRQYDMVEVGGHWVFVLEVLPEQNAIRTAEGNFNDKTFNDGVWSIDHISFIERPKLAA